MDPQEEAMVMDPQDEAAVMDSQGVATNPKDADYMEDHYSDYSFHQDNFSVASSFSFTFEQNDVCITLGWRDGPSIQRCHIFPRSLLAGSNLFARVKNLKQVLIYLLGTYYESAVHLKGSTARFAESIELSEYHSELLRSLVDREVMSCAQVADVLGECSVHVLNRSQNMLLLDMHIHSFFDMTPDPNILFSVPRERAAPILARALVSLQVAISQNDVKNWHPTFDMYDNDTAGTPPGPTIVYPFPSRQAHKDAVPEDSNYPTRHCFNIFKLAHAVTRLLFERQKADGTMFTFPLPADTQYVGLSRPSRTGHVINVALNFAMRSNPTFGALDGPFGETHFLYHDGRNNGLLLQRLAVIHLYESRAQALVDDLRRYLYTPEALVPQLQAASEELPIDSDSSMVEVKQLVDEACLAELQAYDCLKEAKKALRESSVDMEDSSRAELLNAVESAERLFQQAHEQCCKKRCDENGGTLPILDLPHSVYNTIALHVSGGTTAFSDDEPADTTAVSPSATADADMPDMGNETFDQTLVNDESVDDISDKVAAWRMTMPPSSAELLPIPEAS